MPLSLDEVVQRALTTLSAEERDTAAVYLDERAVPAGEELTIDGRTLHRERELVVVFVDLEPMLNWGHRCRYLLVDREGGEVEAVEALVPTFFREERPTLRVVWRGPSVPAWAVSGSTGAARGE